MHSILSGEEVLQNTWSKENEVGKKWRQSNEKKLACLACVENISLKCLTVTETTGILTQHILPDSLLHVFTVKCIFALSI